MTVYTKLNPIGVGGQGSVWRCRNEVGETVAVKFLNPSPSDPDRVLERFRREVVCMTVLKHPNIVSVLESDLENLNASFAMPLADGSLDSLIADNPSGIDEMTAVKLFEQMTAAIAYAHSNNVIHRDLKPANILLYSGHAAITDFGLGRNLLDFPTMTNLGVRGGTEGYMSPEQQTDLHSATTRSDVFALGLILYEMLCGTRAYDDFNLDYVDPRFHFLLEKSLKATPENRFQDGDELLRAFMSVPGVVDSLEHPTSRAQKMIQAMNHGDDDAADSLIELFAQYPGDASLYLSVLVSLEKRSWSKLSTKHRFPEVVGNFLRLAASSSHLTSFAPPLSYALATSFVVASDDMLKIAIADALVQLVNETRGWYELERLREIHSDQDLSPMLNKHLAATRKNYPQLSWSRN